MIELSVIERSLEDLLPGAETPPVELSQAMRWAVLGGGKRVRVQLCLAAAIAVGGSAETAMLPACAIEFLHAYTLVHDDLPAMDNDTVRRGRPTVWARFGEATAILTGDALQALAFATAARTPCNANQVVSALAEAAGAVVSGQMDDLAAGARDFSVPGAGQEVVLSRVFAGKTASLFIAAVKMGALAARAAPGAVALVADYAYHLGFAFQYQDDLLDGDDGAFSSLTVLGADEVRRRVEAHTASALAALSSLPGDTASLITLAQSLVNRRQ